MNGQDAFTAPVPVTLRFEPETGLFRGRLSLRAERDGRGKGRDYTVNIVAQDASVNSASAACTVTVPKNQQKQQE